MVLQGFKKKGLADVPCSTTARLNHQGQGHYCRKWQQNVQKEVVNLEMLNADRFLELYRYATIHHKQNLVQERTAVANYYSS